MKVKYVGKERMDFVFANNEMDLIPGKVYDVLSVERHCWLRIVDESEEDYIYPPDFFVVTDYTCPPFVIRKKPKELSYLWESKRNLRTWNEKAFLYETDIDNNIDLRKFFWQVVDAVINLRTEPKDKLQATFYYEIGTMRLDIDAQLNDDEEVFAIKNHLKWKRKHPRMENLTFDECISILYEIYFFKNLPNTLKPESQQKPNIAK